MARGWSGELRGNWTVLVPPSIVTGTVTGKSMGVLEPAAVGESRWNWSAIEIGSLSSSVRARRNGTGFSLRNLEEPNPSSGVIGRDPKTLSSEPERVRFVSAIENKLKGSSVRPKR